MSDPPAHNSEQPTCSATKPTRAGFVAGRSGNPGGRPKGSGITFGALINLADKIAGNTALPAEVRLTSVLALVKSAIPLLPNGSWARSRAMRELDARAVHDEQVGQASSASVGGGAGGTAMEPPDPSPLPLSLVGGNGGEPPTGMSPCRLPPDDESEPST